jgi:DNA (cytosine-5)-methyltransferase 1
MSDHLVSTAQIDPALFVGPWSIKVLDRIKPNGLKVFSCFHCGGGSTMGYKLAGYKVLGGVDIDKDMVALYRANHNPQHSYLMGVEEFMSQPSLPAELYDLDILDGSPPCSSFSIAGSREDKWGVESCFREGQAKQRLDDLFFHFIDIAAKLKPKIVVAENVKGLIIGKAKGYVAEIFQEFNKAGYRCQLFLLNASRMGVPQSRERTFFIARKEGNPVSFQFSEPSMTVGEALNGADDLRGAKPLEPFLGSKGAREWRIRHNEHRIEQWRIMTQGKPGYFNNVIALPDRPAPTQTASQRHIHWASNRRLSDAECTRLQTFPDDYNYLGRDAGYVCGMSVPLFMMQRVALEIGRQAFGIDYDHTRRPLA